MGGARWLCNPKSVGAPPSRYPGLPLGLLRCLPCLTRQAASLADRGLPATIAQRCSWERVAFEDRLSSCSSMIAARYRAEGSAQLLCVRNVQPRAFHAWTLYRPHTIRVYSPAPQL